MNSILRVGFGILFLVFLLPHSASFGSGEPKPEGRVLISQDFQEWLWLPIPYSVRQEGKKALAEGRTLSFEHRGPLFRVPKGFGNLPAGRMVEGPEAFGGGRSMLLAADHQSDQIVGLHGPYGHLLEPGKSYTYRVALKGRGKFYFRAWVDGVDPATGKTAWLDFPNLIAIPVTDAWKTYSGSFRMPEYDRPPYRTSAKISAAIVVEHDSTVCVDDFQIREGGD